MKISYTFLTISIKPKFKILQSLFDGISFQRGDIISHFTAFWLPFPFCWKPRLWYISSLSNRFKIQNIRESLIVINSLQIIVEIVVNFSNQEVEFEAAEQRSLDGSILVARVSQGQSGDDDFPRCIWSQSGKAKLVIWRKFKMWSVGWLLDNQSACPRADWGETCKGGSSTLLSLSVLKLGRQHYQLWKLWRESTVHLVNTLWERI